MTGPNPNAIYPNDTIKSVRIYYRLTGAVQVKIVSNRIKLEPKRVGKFCIDLFHY